MSKKQTPEADTAVQTDAESILDEMRRQVGEARWLTSLEQEQGEAAAAVIEQYAPRGRMTAVVAEMDDLAEEYRVRANIALDRAQYKVREAFARLVNDPDTRIGMVTLSLDDPEWTDPMVFHVCLRPGQRVFVPGKQEAAALCYFPTSQYVDKRTGELRPTWKDVAGYSHVIAYYPSFTSAREASSELWRAVRTFQDLRERTSIDPDAINETVAEQSAALARLGIHLNEGARQAPVDSPI